MLPNWTIRYSGLGRLPWFNEHFKSVNINHSYKSVFAVGSYNSYSTFQEYMNGLGFVSDALQECQHQPLLQKRLCSWQLQQLQHLPGVYERSRLRE